jgi:DNA-binding NarL/FixJ family response regulator
LLAIKSVYNGGVYYCPETSVHLTKEIEKQKLSREKIKEKLSTREIEIIVLICKGNSNKQIASIIGLSKRTVENYREKIMGKLEIKTSMELVVYAMQHDIYKN